MTPQATRMSQEFTDQAGARTEAAYRRHCETGQRLSAVQPPPEYPSVQLDGREAGAPRAAQTHTAQPTRAAGPRPSRLPVPLAAWAVILLVGAVVAVAVWLIRRTR